LIRGADDSQTIKKRVIFSEGINYGAEKKSIISGNWKLIYNTGIKYKKAFGYFGDSYRELERLFFGGYRESLELYNLSNDPKERTNLVDKHPEIAQKLFFLMKKVRLAEEYKGEKNACRSQ